MRVPDQKEIIALLKNVGLKNWQFAANAVQKHSELSQYIQKALICGISVAELNTKKKLKFGRP